MPELPEVETFKNYLESTSLCKEIKSVKVRDDRVLNVSEKELQRELKNKKFSTTIRHGKYLFVKINSKFLVLHFGMSGYLKAFNNINDEPTHSRVLFEFKDGSFLSYISQRMFGRVDLCNNMKKYLKQKKLGPDALNMNYQEFIGTLKRRTTISKTFLMNQNIIAGIGNIYSDEILFQAKINPKTKINEVDEKKLKDLFNNIKEVLKYGIENEGELGSYSPKFLIPHRQKDEECPVCGATIERFELSGRHGFYCPKCQK
ncbi:MAG: DNA-formamidopyrimidine glycosylase [Candidatus Heimdallarchaeota archaeon]